MTKENETIRGAPCYIRGTYSGIVNSYPIVLGHLPSKITTLHILHPYIKCVSIQSWGKRPPNFVLSSGS
jgi:hypothetical protein